jgi:hypothetical protein
MDFVDENWRNRTDVLFIETKDVLGVSLADVYLLGHWIGEYAPFGSSTAGRAGVQRIDRRAVLLFADDKKSATRDGGRQPRLQRRFILYLQAAKRSH